MGSSFTSGSVPLYKSKQTFTCTIDGGNAYGNATITSVDTTKAWVQNNGATGVDNTFPTNSAKVVLATATIVQATVQTAPSNNTTLVGVVLEQF